VTTLVSALRSAIRARQRQYELREQLKSLRESEERYRQLADLLPTAVYTCDASGLITFYNRHAARLWGRAPQSGDTDQRFCGSDQMILPDGTALAHDDCPMAITLREGRTFRDEEVHLRQPGGQIVPVLVNIDPIRNEQGQVIGAINAFHDISAIRHAEHAMRQSEERFRNLADNISQFAWTADATGWIFWYNHRWFEYTGTTLEEMQGWGWMKVHHPEHVDRVVEKFSRHIASGEPWEDTFPLRGKDGSYRWFLSRARPIRDQHSHIVRWFGTNTDVTEQQIAEEALRRADRRKDEFLAVLAHELRNPLAPIRTGLQVVQLCGDDRDTAAETLQMMDRQLQQLVRLIDDLMDVSRITRGKIELRREPCELRTILSMAIEASRPAIEAAGVEFSVSMPCQDIELDADAARLSQVFLNLLTNAAKYTDRGGRIWLRAEQRETSVVVSVRDSGIGIPPEMLSRIFDMFTQADRSERSHGGLGIGLSLVRAFVQLHGGTVEAHSEGPGHGSEFRVCLPVGRHARRLPQEGARRDQPAEARRILVVDDNVDAAKSLGMMLQLMGNEVQLAHDGWQAIGACEVFRPDIVLLDLGMPKLNGYEAARRIRQEPWGRDIILAALTGWGQDDDRRRTKEAGFDVHLVKPVDRDALEGLLKTAPTVSTPSAHKGQKPTGK
jgi:PAS domain S-box-containing protein